MKLLTILAILALFPTALYAGQQNRANNLSLYQQKIAECLKDLDNITYCETGNVEAYERKPLDIYNYEGNRKR